MALPVGVSTCQITYGATLSPVGAVAAITGRVLMSQPVFHAASKTTMRSGADEVAGAESVSFVVPHVDQPGYVDAAGQAVTMWHYTFVGQVRFANNVSVQVRIPFQPRVGTATLDLDEVAALPVDAETLPLTVVSSVAGLTGKVKAEDLAAALGGESIPDGAFRIYATDDEAVADAHPEFAWVILAPPDETAPTVPTGLVATPGDSQVALTWSASSDDTGTSGYRVRRGGTLIASPTGTSHLDDTAVNDTTYSYTVAAVDAAGNESAQTAPVTATPAAPSGGELIASDDFTRADTGSSGETASALGTTPVGGKPWTKYGFAAYISGNKATMVGANGPGRTVATIDAAVTDVKVTATMATATGDLAASPTGICVRHDPATGFYIALVAYSDLYRLQAFDGNFDGGGDYIQVTPLPGPAPAQGDVIAVEAVGTHYRVFVDGSLLGEGDYVGAINPAATRVGLYGRGSQFNAYLDDFAVETA